MRTAVKPLMRHSFMGKRFDIFVAQQLPPGRLAGTTSRRAKKPAIAFDARISDQRQAMEILIHEGLHACFDKKLTEKQVTQAAKDISRFLWKLGFEAKDDG